MLQVAASVALALAAAKDYHMQESARFLGAVPSLVELAAGYSVSAAEVARLALLAVKHHNERNGQEITCVLRSRRYAAAILRGARRLVELVECR